VLERREHGGAHLVDREGAALEVGGEHDELAAAAAQHQQQALVGAAQPQDRRAGAAQDAVDVGVGGVDGLGLELEAGRGAEHPALEAGRVGRGEQGGGWRGQLAAARAQAGVAGEREQGLVQLSQGPGQFGAHGHGVGSGAGCPGGQVDSVFNFGCPGGQVDSVFNFGCPGGQVVVGAVESVR
jgi:hypothetical protein